LTNSATVQATGAHAEGAIGKGRGEVRSEPNVAAIGFIGFRLRVVLGVGVGI
jgi:hypothetical protein